MKNNNNCGFIKDSEDRWTERKGQQDIREDEADASHNTAPQPNSKEGRY